MKLRILTCCLILTATLNLQAQDNVGIGTLTPNPNALLDMNANDKGLLIPRLTSVQRTGISTGIAETGLLVFDTDDLLFYYWDGTVWIPFPQITLNTDNQTLSIAGDQLSIANGNTITLPDNVDDADADVTNELQLLSYDADSIYLSNGNAIALLDILDGTGTDDQALSINSDTIFLEDGGFVLLPAPTVDTDDQTLSILGDQLSIADGNTITLPDNVDDADADATNELQLLSYDADSIYLSNGNAIALLDILDGTGTDDQALSINSDTIFLEDGGYVLLPTPTVDTDDQTLSVLGDQLSIADGNTITLPDNVDDADADATNELQLLSYDADSIYLSNGNAIALLDILDGTGTDNQALSINSDTIFLEDGGYVLLPTPTVDTDDQTLSIAGDQLSIADGNTITLPDNVDDADADATNELQLLSYDADSIYISNGNAIALLDILDGTGTDDQVIDQLTLNGDTMLQISLEGDGIAPIELDLSPLLGGDEDWTVVGNNQYSAVSGNVGIGITVPAQKLDVEGIVRLNPENHIGTSINRIAMLDATGDVNANDPASLAVNDAVTYDFSGKVVKPGTSSIFDLPGPTANRTVTSNFVLYSTCDASAIPIYINFKRFGTSGHSFSYSVGNGALTNSTAISIAITFDLGCGPLTLNVTLNTTTNELILSPVATSGLNAVYVHSGRTTFFRWL